MAKIRGKTRPKATAAQIAEIGRLVNSGLAVRAIAKRMKLGVSQVYGYVKKQRDGSLEYTGLRRKREPLRHQRRTDRKPMATDHQIRTICDLKKQGMSAPNIAARMSLGRSVVYRYLKKQRDGELDLSKLAKKRKYTRRAAVEAATAATNDVCFCPFCGKDIAGVARAVQEAREGSQ